MLKRIQTLEDEKELQERSIVNKIDMGGFVAQKGLWNFSEGKILRERGELPKEEGDVVRTQGYASRKFLEQLAEGRWER